MGIMTHPQILSWHVLLFLAGLLMVLITDACGLLYLVGWRKQMNGLCLRLKHAWIASMGAATVGTGLLLLFQKPEVMGQSAFWVKMGLVAALCVNGWLIGRKIPLLMSGSFRSLERRTRWALLSGAIGSLMFWVGAAFLGLMI